MRYIGSKTSTVEKIYNLASKHVKNGSFCDPFGGMAIVSSYFKEQGYEVHTGDVLRFAHYFQIAKLTVNRTPSFIKLKQHLEVKSTKDLLKYLNSLKSRSGWFIDNYSSQRKFFTFENAAKIQACWYAIIRYDKLRLLSIKEKAFLLASLINSMDKVANTAGTYYAFLKKLDRKAKNKFEFELIKPIKGEYLGESYKIDAIQLLAMQNYDIIYLDPPYNDRKYQGYYHLPETIANCTIRKVSGKSGVCQHDIEFDANFYSSQTALTSLKKIIENSKFKLLIFHYRDDGLIKPTELKSLFKQFNVSSESFFDSLGYTTQSVSRKSENHIYLIHNVNTATQ